MLSAEQLGPRQEGVGGSHRARLFQQHCRVGQAGALGHDDADLLARRPVFAPPCHEAEGDEGGEDRADQQDAAAEAACRARAGSSCHGYPSVPLLLTHSCLQGGGGGAQGARRGRDRVPRGDAPRVPRFREGAAAARSRPG